MLLRIRSQQEQKEVSGPTIWIHCASGEFEYAKSILREIKDINPRTKILVSYFSPSYKTQIERTNLVDYSQILPLDLAGPIQNFIKKFKPNALIIARSDLWPELLSQCAKNNIPTLLFSHTKSSTSPLTRPFEKPIYNLLTDIYVVSESDKDNLKKITDKPVVVAGDTRYDQVQFRLQNRTASSKSQIYEGRNFFIAGSTWPEDEAALIYALTQIPNLPTVLVPHENDKAHLQNLEKELTRAGLQFVRLSQIETWPENTILIVDQMGLLADLYAHCKFAFVGGSFKKKVHSVMEPLGAKKPVIVGPFYKNNREAIIFSQVRLDSNTMAVSVAQTQEELLSLLLQINKLQDLHNEKTAAIIQTEFTIKTGATKMVTQWLKQKGALS